MYAYCNNVIAQLFQKTFKMVVPFPHTPPRTPPLSTLKNPSNLLYSRENSLQLDEEIKSLAIKVAEK